MDVPLYPPVEKMTIHELVQKYVWGANAPDIGVLEETLWEAGIDPLEVEERIEEAIAKVAMRLAVRLPTAGKQRVEAPAKPTPIQNEDRAIRERALKDAVAGEARRDAGVELTNDDIF